MMDELRRIIREEVKRILQEGELEFIKGGKHTWHLKNDGLHISAANPHIRLEGTETGGADKGIREDGGTLKIYDFASASNVMDLEAHASRHLSGGADEVLNLTNINDAIGFSVDAHASRHVEGGADPISGLTASQLAANTILFKIPVLIPDSPQTGLAADSTGTKWTSNFKFRIPKQNVKDVVIRATWSASNTDSTTEIALIDDATGNTVCSVSGNTGTDAESTNYTEANLSDDGLVYARASITTASATTGATFDITYVAVEIKVAVS